MNYEVFSQIPPLVADLSCAAFAHHPTRANPTSDEAAGCRKRTKKERKGNASKEKNKGKEQRFQADSKAGTNLPFRRSISLNYFHLDSYRSHPDYRVNFYNSVTLLLIV